MRGFEIFSRFSVYFQVFPSLKIPIEHFNKTYLYTNSTNEISKNIFICFSLLDFFPLFHTVSTGPLQAVWGLFTLLLKNFMASE